MKPSTHNIQAFFDRNAQRRKSRILSRYYWNEIIQYCKYFAHTEFRILEIGCGSGDLLHTLPAKHKTGVDISSEQLKWAREKYPNANIEWIQQDAHVLNLHTTYDLIILSNLIGFTEDIQMVFEALKPLCHAQTKIIVQFYNALWEPVLKWSERLGIRSKTPLQNWLSTRDINNLLHISGFEVFRNSKRMVFPFYIPILSHIINRYLAHIPPFRFFCWNLYSFARLQPASTYPETSVSIIIPARNESGNIAKALERMPNFGLRQEVIFIEGNSTDNTWETLTQLANTYTGPCTIQIAQQSGKGKADAVRKGFDMATGEVLMILDADLTVPPEDLPKFYHALISSKGDFINGTRLVYPMDKDAMRFLNYLGNHFFSWAFTWLLGQRFKDTLCGTKVLYKSDYQKLVKNRDYFGNFDPFGDFDLLFGAHKLNLKITEVPIRYKERTYGSTNISRFKHGIILLRMCLFASRKCKFI